MFCGESVADDGNKYYEFMACPFSLALAVLSLLVLVQKVDWIVANGMYLFASYGH